MKELERLERGTEKVVEKVIYFDLKLYLDFILLKSPWKKPEVMAML